MKKKRKFLILTGKKFLLRPTLRPLWDGEKKNIINYKVS